MRQVLETAGQIAGKKRGWAGVLARIAKQHEKGKLTARERIELLLDERIRSKNSTCIVTHRCTDFGMQGNRRSRATVW